MALSSTSRMRSGNRSAIVTSTFAGADKLGTRCGLNSARSSAAHRCAGFTGLLTLWANITWASSAPPLLFPGAVMNTTGIIVAPGNC